MARGHQKALSQQKNAAKKNQQKSGGDQKASAKKALVHQCPVCKSQMPDLKTFEMHFTSKHPKSDLPDVLKEYQSGQSTSSAFQSQMPDLKTFEMHFTSKHPKSDLPDVLKEYQSGQSTSSACE